MSMWSSALDNVNRIINVLISTPDERPPLLKGHFSKRGGPTRGVSLYVENMTVLTEALLNITIVIQ